MSFMQIPNTFSAFPVAGKKPLVEWGEYSKRHPSTQERSLWKTKYPGCQFGIATGPVSKILVLDDDGGLEQSGYKVPKTWTASTPSGGKHHYFKWIPELESKITTKVGVLPQVDTRGDGGYVVFYGFQAPFVSTPLAFPPRWLVELLPNKSGYWNPTQTAPQSSEGPIYNTLNIKELLDAITVGNRNDSFFRVASSLRARGYSSSDIFGILSAKAREVGFGLDELQTITESAGRYEPNERVDNSQAASIEEFLKDQEKVEWICEGLIAKKSIGFIAGLPETGKTWVLMDLAVECARGGGLWLGKFPVESAKVLFIDQERFRGETQRRLKTIIRAKDLEATSLKSALFVRVGSSTRLNLQHSFEAFRKELSEIKPDLVIIDSFVTFHTSEENNRQSIQAVLERVKDLRNEFGCTFLFIHHENKNAFDKESGEPSISQMAGSIAIPAVAETVFTVRKHDSESSMVYMTKNTLSPCITPFLVKVVDNNEEKTSISVLAY